MKFALFFELSVPRPWTAEAEARVFANSLEQAILADELGFDQIWIAEHHFLEEYSHSSAPDLFLTACAMRTKHIRLGQGIATCVPEINHAVRIAERAAWLDIISGGRLELGTGRSSTWTELGGFGADPEFTKKAWDEYVRVIPRMWTEERLSWDGVAFSMPERAVLPKPLQKPHPPMWVAVTSPGTDVEAGERGLGCLGLVTGGVSEQERRINRYREALTRCEPVGAFVNDQVNTTNYLFCHEDPKEAAKVGNSLADSFSSAAAQMLMVKESYPTNTYKAPGLLASLRTEISSDGTKKVPDGLTLGTPDQIAEVVTRWESIGVDCMMFLVNAMEVVPQQDVLDSIRLFAKEVMPRFRRRTADRSEYSQEDYSRSRNACRNRSWVSMHQRGALDVESRVKACPVVSSPATENFALGEGRVLQFLFETPLDLRMLPPSQHPSIPEHVSVLAWDCEESPFGPARVVQVRVGCRTGILPRGFVVSAFSDNAALARVLRDGWGFPIREAAIFTSYRASRFELGVEQDSKSILRANLRDPVRVPDGQLQVAGSLNLVRIDGGQRLIQADFTHSLEPPQIGAPVLETFDAAALGEPLMKPGPAIVASEARGSIELRSVRYLIGTSELAADDTVEISKAEVTS